MNQTNVFSGLSAAFWGLTFTLIGFSFFVASVGGYDLIRAFLASMAIYSVLGIAYGCWAARNAVLRSKRG